MLTLTAKDSGGLTSTASLNLQPQTVQVTLATTPSGLDVVYDGTKAKAPMTLDFDRQLEAHHHGADAPERRHVQVLVG